MVSSVSINTYLGLTPWINWMNWYGLSFSWTDSKGICKWTSSNPHISNDVSLFEGDKTSVMRLGPWTVMVTLCNILWSSDKILSTDSTCNSTFIVTRWKERCENVTPMCLKLRVHYNCISLSKEYVHNLVFYLWHVHVTVNSEFSARLQNILVKFIYSEKATIFF